MLSGQKRNFVKVEIEESGSMDLAAELTRVNMLPYYKSRNITWDPERYEQTWLEFENFDVKYQGQWVGILRFSSDENALYVRDIQIDSKYQKLGIGVQCLKYALDRAKSQALSRLRLLVFSENPALNLYKKFGFKSVGESNGLIKMELIV